MRDWFDYNSAQQKAYIPNIMNYLLTNTMCCCLQCCCKQLYQTLQKLLQKTSFTKLMYMIIYLSFIIIVMAGFLLLKDWPFFMNYIAQGIQCTQIKCLVNSVMVRTVLAIVIIGMVNIILILITSNRVAAIVNEGLFFTKFVIITVLFVVFLQINNTFFQQLFSIYSYISYVFLICQGIIIIDLGYLWGIRWAHKFSSQSSSLYGTLLILSTIILFGSTIVMNIYGYFIVSSMDQGQQECSNFPNIVNTVFVFLCVGIQLLNFNKQNSLVATGLVCFYITIWCLQAVFQAGSCHVNEHVTDIIDGQSGFYTIETIIAVFWLILSLFGSVFGSTNRMSDSNSQVQQIQFVRLDQHAQKASLNAQSSKAQGIFQQNKRNWIIWHLFMLTMMIYLSMVLSNWGSSNIITQKYSLNQNSFNSKIFIACFTFIGYVWTLVAPRLFPSRNFYFV